MSSCKARRCRSHDVTMKSIQPDKILNDIRRLKNDLDKFGLTIPPSLVGIYGELLAYQKIKRLFGPRGYKVVLGAGQSKADIQLIKQDTKINVEVKTSRLKDEWYGKGYGFAINIKKCKTHEDKRFKHPKKGELSGDFCYFDCVVAVVLLRNLNNHEFYVFPKSFIEKNEKFLRNRNARFNSSTHRIIFAVEPKTTSELTSFDKRLSKTRSKYKNAWHALRGST